ncbi:MAG: precorrin-6A synthase (deacetylating) [Beijerinckiaceae bacterium]|nr:precorrin-6A synthase (deacetylating) [Beijerinckiaceae bacterium]
MPKRLQIIGIGVGDPNHMTVEAVEALNAADVFFIPDKGAEKAELRALRMAVCERFITGSRHRFVEYRMPSRKAEFTDYRTNVEDWHAEIEAIHADLIEAHLKDGECGAFLVWGDPALYDSTLRIFRGLQRRGLAFEWTVIPGIMSVQLLAARHRIALHEIGEPVTIAPARKLATLAADPTRRDIVVVLDGQQAFEAMDDDLHIYWGAYLGSEHEILIEGRLGDVKAQIAERRREARERHGWIMDTYLLRRVRA